VPAATQAFAAGGIAHNGKKSPYRGAFFSRLSISDNVLQYTLLCSAVKKKLGSPPDQIWLLFSRPVCFASPMSLMMIRLSRL
jgi:hypothetical protein